MKTGEKVREYEFPEREPVRATPIPVEMPIPAEIPERETVSVPNTVPEKEKTRNE